MFSERSLFSISVTIKQTLRVVQQNVGQFNKKGFLFLAIIQLDGVPFLMISIKKL